MSDTSVDHDQIESAPGSRHLAEGRRDLAAIGYIERDRHHARAMHRLQLPAKAGQALTRQICEYNGIALLQELFADSRAYSSSRTGDHGSVPRDGLTREGVQFGSLKRVVFHAKYLSLRELVIGASHSPDRGFCKQILFCDVSPDRSTFESRPDGQSSCSLHQDDPGKTVTWALRPRGESAVVSRIRSSILIYVGPQLRRQGIAVVVGLVY